MNVDYIVTLKDKFTPTAKKMNKQIQHTDKSVEKLNKSATRTGGSLKKMLISGAALFGAFRLGKDVLESWNKQAQAVAQVRQGLISTKNASGKTLTQLEKQAAYLQKNSLYGDEDVLQGVTAQLLTFTNITGSAFDRTQQMALDLSTKLKVDLKSSAIQLGKALNDPIHNLSALSRAGIQFTDKQKAMVKAMWLSGKQAQAQSLILGELEKQYGGSAKAAALAGLGPLKQLQMRIGDLKEKVGGLLFKVLMKLQPVFNKIITSVEHFFSLLGKNSKKLHELGSAISGIFGAFKKVGDSILNFFKSISGANGNLLDNITQIAKVIEKFIVPIMNKISKGINKMFKPLSPIINKIYIVLKKTFVDIFQIANTIFGAFSEKFGAFSKVIQFIYNLLLQSFIFLENILKTEILPIITNIIQIAQSLFAQLKPILAPIWSIMQNLFTVTFALGKVIFEIVRVLIRWVKLFMNSGIGKFIINVIITPLKAVIKLLDIFLKGVAKLAKLAGLDFTFDMKAQNVSGDKITGRTAKNANKLSPILDKQKSLLKPISPVGKPLGGSPVVGSTKTTGGSVTKIVIDKLIETLNITAENVTESTEQIKKIVVEALTEGLNDITLVTK